ncbi:unnamed protein product [Effrenium voratum]|uniref:RING-type domain-containing protein n=1 Tax=Effrenium voratum TaxID=2562239 RepID=A0AA36I9S1_9DINO|nr:unnamed protein product [Effrenium voratum]
MSNEGFVSPDRRHNVVSRWKVCFPKKKDFIISVKSDEKDLAETLLQRIRELGDAPAEGLKAFCKAALDRLRADVAGADEAASDPPSEEEQKDDWEGLLADLVGPARPAAPAAAVPAVPAAAPAAPAANTTSTVKPVKKKDKTDKLTKAAAGEAAPAPPVETNTSARAEAAPDVGAGSSRDKRRRPSAEVASDVVKEPEPAPAASPSAATNVRARPAGESGPGPLDCPICWEPYDGDKREPGMGMGKCEHTVGCKRCVKDLLRRQRVGACPLCRREFTEFRRNLGLRSVVAAGAPSGAARAEPQLRPSTVEPGFVDPPSACRKRPAPPAAPLRPKAPKRLPMPRPRPFPPKAPGPVPSVSQGVSSVHGEVKKHINVGTNGVVVSQKLLRHLQAEIPTLEASWRVSIAFVKEGDKFTGHVDIGGPSCPYVQRAADQLRAKCSEEAVISVKVPEDLVGCIIGKGGQVIKELEVLHGVSIKKMQIKGPRHKCCTCAERLELFVERSEEIQEDVSINPALGGIFTRDVLQSIQMKEACQRVLELVQEDKPLQARKNLVIIQQQKEDGPVLTLKGSRAAVAAGRARIQAKIDKTTVLVTEVPAPPDVQALVPKLKWLARHGVNVEVATHVIRMRDAWVEANELDSNEAVEVTLVGELAACHTARAEAMSIARRELHRQRSDYASAQEMERIVDEFQTSLGSLPEAGNRRDRATGKLEEVLDTSGGETPSGRGRASCRGAAAGRSWKRLPAPMQPPR